MEEFWENTSYPRCGHQSIVIWDERNRIWCCSCNFKPIYTHGTPFHEKHLTAGEVFLAFTPYADTLLSINQTFLGRAYRIVHTAIRKIETAVQPGFPVVWSLLDQTIGGPTQVNESGKSAQATKAKSRRGTAVLVATRSRLAGHAGGVVTVIN